MKIVMIIKPGVKNCKVSLNIKRLRGSKNKPVPKAEKKLFK